MFYTIPVLGRFLKKSDTIFPKTNNFLGRNLLERLHRRSFVCWTGSHTWIRGIWGHPISFSREGTFISSIPDRVNLCWMGRGRSSSSSTRPAQPDSLPKAAPPSRCLPRVLFCLLTTHEPRLRAADRDRDRWVSSGESTAIASSSFRLRSARVPQLSRRFAQHQLEAAHPSGLSWKPQVCTNQFPPPFKAQFVTQPR